MQKLQVKCEKYKEWKQEYQEELIHRDEFLAKQKHLQGILEEKLLRKIPDGTTVYSVIGMQRDIEKIRGKNLILANECEHLRAINLDYSNRFKILQDENDDNLEEIQNLKKDLSL